MAAADPARLARLHRVRTLQLNVVRGDEARANDRHASEAALNDRIAALAEDIAPATVTAGAFALGAAAHFRERLHRSQDSARERLALAERAAAAASEATRAARRDQNAVEKLLVRADAARTVKEMQALIEDAFSTQRKNRHDPC